jgi:hypothetical protein
MTDNATFHNGTMQWAYFRLIRSHCAIAELLQIAQFRKNSPSTKFTEDVTVCHKRTRILQKQSRWYSKAHRWKKGDRNRERFFYYNIVKGHKVTNLARPNELGTTMIMVATKSADRTWLQKWLRAPSHNTAKDNQPGYTVVFKGRT